MCGGDDPRDNTLNNLARARARDIQCDRENPRDRASGCFRLRLREKSRRETTKHSVRNGTPTDRYHFDPRRMPFAYNQLGIGAANLRATPYAPYAFSAFCISAMRAMRLLSAIRPHTDTRRTRVTRHEQPWSSSGFHLATRKALAQCR